jgi:hypothetical protein
MLMQSLTDELFLEEAFRIMEEAEKHGIILRLLGSVAIKLHCPNFSDLYTQANRPLTDLDFMTYGQFNSSLREFFENLGYTTDERILRYFGRYRHIYHSNKVEGLHVDIFFDQLSFCHPINFKGRLEIDNPTIPLAELLLEKMQIVEINEKDLKDTVILLREHQIGSSSSDEIDGKYVAKTLSNDWGFYYTLTTNLNKVEQYLKDFSQLTEADRQVISQRLDDVRQLIEAEPKSLKWKLREKVGTKVRWYREVEEVDR